MINYDGQIFNHLTIIKDAFIKKDTNSGKSRRFLECQCECGKIVNVRLDQIKSGHTKSCGCKKRENQLKAVTTHGHTNGGVLTREFSSWLHMRDRCNNPKNKAYHNYGGTGVKVCVRWENSFENFLKDMGAAPSQKHTLDRYPNKNGMYEPSNCRWATMKEQQNNKSTNRSIEYGNEKMNATDWAKKLNIRRDNFYWHLDRGRTIEEIIKFKKIDYVKKEIHPVIAYSFGRIS